MQTVIKSDFVKTNFDLVKKRWTELLSKYFLEDKKLNPFFTINIPCPHCHHKEITDSFVLNGFCHNSCENCKTVYVSPRLSDECIEALYQDEYYNQVYIHALLPVFEKRKQLIGLSKFHQSIFHWQGKNSGKVLDIGAGIGEVIDVFRDHHWQTHAIEMNKVAIEWLQNRKYDELYRGSFDNYKTEEKFDIIMAWGVVEHVVDPDVFLQKVHRLLAPGGLFVSEVPHGACLLVDMTKKTGKDPKRIIMGEQHIVLYSVNAYENLHRRNGLDKIHIQTNGLDIDTLFKEYAISVSDETMIAMQACVDERMYGDLLRGFWRKH